MMGVYRAPNIRGCCIYTPRTPPAAPLAIALCTLHCPCQISSLLLIALTFFCIDQWSDCLISQGSSNNYLYAIHC